MFFSPPTDNRASLLRPGTAPKRILNEKDISMHLWKNYTIFACRYLSFMDLFLAYHLKRGIYVFVTNS